MRGVIGLHDRLRPGDVLLGDRAFCSFAHFCLLDARGAFGCFRLHQRRKNTTRGLQKWKKPKQAPKWMSAAQFALLPASITVRVVRYTVAENGFRTREVLVATTLIDDARWTDQRVAELYGRRWPIETCFGHLKTTLKMDTLKCKTKDGVLKELAAFLIAYNLVRLVMLKAAAVLGVPVDRVSFVDAARALAAWMTGSDAAVPIRTNPRRRGRHCPRVVRRRPKRYTRMTKPRSDYSQQPEPSTHTA